METKKTFKPFDKVLTKYGKVWVTDIYSNYTHTKDLHLTMRGVFSENDILPYEGNEHLVGTTDSPDEEVKLEEGEHIMVINKISDKAFYYNLRQYVGITEYDSFITKYADTERVWDFAIRFSDFNPNDMEETKKHILCVKNGKVVKYK